MEHRLRAAVLSMKYLSFLKKKKKKKKKKRPQRPHMFSAIQNAANTSEYLCARDLPKEL
jgi:hypothetical protein